MIKNTDITLTQSGIAADAKVVGDVFNNIEQIIGDTPVSVQLMTALEQHTHKEYAMRDDVEDLKRKIDMLFNLIGDISVAEQIYMAINKT